MNVIKFHIYIKNRWFSRIMFPFLYLIFILYQSNNLPSVDIFKLKVDKFIVIYLSNIYSLMILIFESISKIQRIPMYNILLSI